MSSNPTRKLSNSGNFTKTPGGSTRYLSRTLHEKPLTKFICGTGSLLATRIIPNRILRSATAPQIQALTFELAEQCEQTANKKHIPHWDHDPITGTSTEKTTIGSSCGNSTAMVNEQATAKKWVKKIQTICAPGTSHLLSTMGLT